MKTKTLTTKARDNYGHTYAVILVEKDNQFGQGKKDWVLKIDGTPGQWYITTLEEGGFRNRIAIDLGQRWYCINLDAVMVEALVLLEGEDRISAVEVKRQDDAMWANLAARM